ncbi:DUF5694 domain-containing protein [Neolewinella persica]|uniref:DUF5694 domain-containing protein n=1 Tax=Neolewinella persica TaxID=70998 RepID=UPI00036B2B3D|nr:DUF5694 domain-containing protein [Neolewinella persica]
MRSFLTLLLLTLICTSVRAQKIPDLNTFDPDEILIGKDKLPKVLLVGSFHFNYPNLDSHVTSSEDQVDVKTAAKQAELRELLDYIARFKPNKIVVERRSGSTINDTYQKYLDGKHELGKGEIEQLAFRLGKQFGIDTLILGDDRTLSNSLYWHKDSLVLRPLMDSLFTANDPTSDTTIDKRYFQLYDLEDKMDARAELLEVFKYMNSTHRIKRGHGHYLTFDSDESPDALAIWWYSRNLRIYRKIQKATTSPDDRIMVLFGAGHLGILRQQFESSPAYELVDFGSL